MLTIHGRLVFPAPPAPTLYESLTPLLPRRADSNLCQNDWYSQCQPGSAATTAVPAPTTAVPTTAVPAPTGSAKGLDALFKAKGKKYFGTCSDSALLGVSQNDAIIKSDFGQLTPENSMKWDALQRSRGVYSFGGADTLVAYAQANNKLLRGHTLVWHSQLPSWVSAVSTAAELTKVIQDHVAAVAGRYKGKI